MRYVGFLLLLVLVSPASFGGPQNAHDFLCVTLQNHRPLFKTSRLVVSFVGNQVVLSNQWKPYSWGKLIPTSSEASGEYLNYLGFENLGKGESYLLRAQSKLPAGLAGLLFFHTNNSDIRYECRRLSEYSE